MLTQLLPHALLGAAVAPTTHSCRAVLFGVQHSVHIPAPGRGAVDWAHFLEHVLKARSHLCAMWTNARIMTTAGRGSRAILAAGRRQDSECLLHGVRRARSEGNREFFVTYSWIGSIWLGGDTRCS